MPPPDPEQTAKWEALIEKCPPYKNHPNVRYFVLKSNNQESLKIAFDHSVWATTHGPSGKLKKALQAGSKVILFFSLTESGGFQGVAEMVAEPDSQFMPQFFQVTPDEQIQYRGNFPIKWIAKDIHFHYRNLNHFPVNPLNEGLTIMQSKNGQEIPQKQGNYLVTLMVDEVKRTRTQRQAEGVRL